MMQHHAKHQIFLLSEKNDIEKGEDVIINLSGRGDKDVNTIAKYLGNII